MNALQKMNDLSSSPLKNRFDRDKKFVPETNFAVAWRRVSTGKQKKSGHFSDEAQLENIQDYVKEEDLSVVRYWDVAETASKHDKRRHFHEMLKLVESSQQTGQPIKHVVFSYTSRSSRNKQSRRELEELLDLGVVIHFARDGFKLDCMSALVEYMNWLLRAFKDEEDITVHRENVWEGLLKRAEHGLFPGKAPYGYKNFRPGENELSYFVFYEGRDAYMKKAFEMMATGRYSEIRAVKELNAMFPHLTKKPTAKRFSALLRNPFYYGAFYWAKNVTKELFKGNPEYHPPLISYELWKQVQDVLSGRRHNRVIQTNHPYLGIIRCGGKILDENGNETNTPCNAAITAEEKRKKLIDGSIKNFYYYHCSNTTRPCSQRSRGYLQGVGRTTMNYSVAEIEMLFEAVFRPLSFTPEVCKWMQDVLRKEHHEKSANHYQHLGALQNRQKMLQKYIDSAYDDKLSGDISEEMWRTKHSQWRTELETVKRQIDAIDDQKEEYIQNGVLLIELAQHTESVYKNAPAEVKRKLVEIVSSNHVLRNGTIEFAYRKPFDILASATPKENWWTRQESNLRPLECHPSALPTELRAHE